MPNLKDTKIAIENQTNKKSSENTEDNINFAPDIEESLFDKIFDWIVTSGRRIIILTEVIVLAVFLSRFWIDRQLHDLKENIESKQAVIESTQDLESNHRKIQNKITILQEVLAQQINWQEWLDNFTQKIPETLTLSGLSLTKDSASVKAKASTVQSFALFVNLLINDPSVKSVVLTESKYDKDKKVYEFGMKIGLTSAQK